MQRQTFDKERVSLNIARMKKEGQCFEIVIDPDLALDYRSGKDVNVVDVLVDEKVFFDAKKGMLASENEMNRIFNTAEPLEVAEIILKEGEVHLTADYKAKLVNEKRRRILGIIHMNGIDPKTRLPHPMARLENAFEEAKIKINEHKSAEDQVQDVLKALKPILPIRFEVKKVEVKLPAKYAGQLHFLAKEFGKILKQDWKNDGSVYAIIELPGGLEQDFYRKLNNFTHGDAEAKALTE